MADHIRRTLHRAKVHASKVLTDHSQAEQLRAGEDRYERGEKCKPRHFCVRCRVANQYESKCADTKQSETEPQPRDEPEGLRAVPRHHVDRMSQQLAKGVVGGPARALIHRRVSGRVSGGDPREQNIDGDVRIADLREPVAQLDRDRVLSTDLIRTRTLPFVASLLRLVDHVRALYPQSLVVCCVGPMLTDTYPPGKQTLTRARAYVRAAVDAKKKAGDARVTYLEFPTQDPSIGYGCDYHPSARTHQLMAERLTAYLRSELGW